MDTEYAEVSTELTEKRRRKLPEGTITWEVNSNLRSTLNSISPCTPSELDELCDEIELRGLGQSTAKNFGCCRQKKRLIITISPFSKIL